jgi:hypothetical protein
MSLQPHNHLTNHHTTNTLSSTATAVDHGRIIRACSVRTVSRQEQMAESTQYHIHTYIHNNDPPICPITVPSVIQCTASPQECKLENNAWCTGCTTAQERVSEERIHGAARTILTSASEQKTDFETTPSTARGASSSSGDTAFPAAPPPHCLPVCVTATDAHQLGVEE